MSIYPAAATEVPLVSNGSALAQETIASIEDKLQVRGTTIEQVLIDLMTAYRDRAQLVETEEEQQQCMLLADSLQTIYDYEIGDQSYPDTISEAAVYSMARAQMAGTIVPYTVQVTVNF